MKPQKALPKWEKEFKKGYSKPFVLLALTKEPHYPYQIIKTLSGATRGKYIIAGSNIYPILKTLTDDGIISARKDEETQQKFYSLTKDGYEFLELLEKSMMEFQDLVKELIETHGALRKNETV
ncbi:MAG: PadR family transcriptional regulator [Candidatus Hodarchaeales archaeon]